MASGARWTAEQYQKYLDSRAEAPRSKYGARLSEVDHIKFHSKKESQRYIELVALRNTRDVLWFARQPIFDLPGGVKYKADFIIAWADGRVTIEDVKGMKTKDYVAKKKMVEAVHNIAIKET